MVYHQMLRGTILTLNGWYCMVVLVDWVLCLLSFAWSSTGVAERNRKCNRKGYLSFPCLFNTVSCKNIIKILNFYCYRVVKASSPYLNIMIIFGVIIIYGDVILFGIDGRVTSSTVLEITCNVRMPQ